MVKARQTVQVRIQSVHTTYLDVSAERGYTLGEQIDNLVKAMHNQDQHPNKIVIDLNPKEEPQDNDIDP